MTTVLERSRKRKPSKNGQPQPTWDIAMFYPMQGDWTEEDFLSLERGSEPRLMELNVGILEILPMPDMYHQDIVEFLFSALKAYLQDHQFGRAYFAPLPVKLWTDQIREPDIVCLASHRIKNKRRPPKGADLAMEVVSPGANARKRDLQEKRRVYAKAKIPEYWIIDPKKKTITVLTLEGKSYKVHGVFKPGDHATSKLLKGFKVAVSEVFAAGEGK